MFELSKVQLRSLAGLPLFIAVTFLLLSPGPLQADVFPDPVCEQHCNDDYIFCLDYICDPRGSCTCWTDYQWCVSNCPELCSEPRSVRTYTQTTSINISNTGVYTCLKFVGPARIHGRFQYQSLTQTLRETTACNGTKTTEVISSVTTGPFICWAPINPQQGCGSPASGFYPFCPF